MGIDFYDKLVGDYYVTVRKPDIPPKVEHWLDNYKDSHDLFDVINLAKNYDNANIHIGNCDEDVAMWIGENPLKFTSAWLNGYAPRSEK